MNSIDLSATLFSHPKLLALIFLPWIAITTTSCTSKKLPPEVIVLNAPSGDASERRISFKNEIAPLLEERCVSCHHDQGPLTGLSFQRRSTILEVEDDRSILVPGDPEKSTLFLVTVLPDYFIEAMPPTGHRLSDREATNLYWWIAQGADWPKDLVLEPKVSP